MFTYEDLIEFVDRNDYHNKPFKEVIALYKEELEDCYNSMIADDYLASVEEHELIMY